MDVRGKTGMKQDTVTAAKLLYERQASFVLCIAELYRRVLRGLVPGDIFKKFENTS